MMDREGLINLTLGLINQSDIVADHFNTSINEADLIFECSMYTCFNGAERALASQEPGCLYSISRNLSFVPPEIGVCWDRLV